MDAAEQWDKVKYLYSTISFGGAVGTPWQTYDPQAMQAWGGELLSRIALLVGDDTVEYATGNIDLEPYAGELVVFTRALIIRAQFATIRASDGSYLLTDESQVYALSRSAATRVDVRRVPLIEAPGEWPNAVGLHVWLDNGEDFDLPWMRFPRQDPALVGFAPSLLRTLAD